MTNPTDPTSIIFCPTLLPRITDESIQAYSERIKAMTEAEGGDEQFRLMRANAAAQFRTENPGVWNLFLGFPGALDALVTFWTLLAIEEAAEIARAN